MNACDRCEKKRNKPLLLLVVTFAVLAEIVQAVAAYDSGYPSCLVYFNTLFFFLQQQQQQQLIRSAVIGFRMVA